MQHKKPTASLVTALFVLLLSTTALAAEIRGTVSNAQNGAPMSGVQVLLTGERLLKESTSNDLGQYVIEVVAEGNFELELTAPGYENLTLTVVLEAGDSLIKDLVMVLEYYQLEELIITGEAVKSDGFIQTGFVNLDSETLSKIPSVIEPDPLRALQILPGVQAASDISSGLYIRGGGPDQNLVLMDGVTVYNPTHAFGFFSTFNSDVVDDVNLYKGAYPAKYGGRLGAVLDVEMKKPESTDFGGKASISLIAARILMEGKLGPDHWQISGRRSYLDPVLKAARTEENPIPDYYFYDLNATYLTTRGGGQTTVQLYHGNDDIGVNAEAQTNFDIGWGNTVLALTHQRQFTDNLEGKLVLSNSRYNSITDAQFLATSFEIENRLNDFTAAATLDWWVATHHRLNFGSSYSWYDFTYRQGFNQELSVDYGAQPQEWASFVEDQWFAGNNTIVRTGLRFRYLSDGGRTLLEPRLSLSHSLSEKLRLKLGAGIYNQYLQLVATEGFSAGDFYLPVDDSTQMGRSQQLVVGADWQASDRNQISLETYITDLKNLLEFDNIAPADQEIQTADQIFVTDGKGYARGMEIFLRHKGEGWTGWLGYTLGWSSRTFDELNGGDPFNPKYDRRHDINALLSFQWGSWSLASSFRYATGQAFTPAAARYQLNDPSIGDGDDSARILSASRNSGRLLPYHRLDISARRPISIFGKPAELVLEVFNLYNRRNEWYVQYDTQDDLTEATVVRQLPLIPSVGVNFEF